VNIQKIIFILTTPLMTACSFNFELTSQKTALENQVMGSYKELDDEVLMVASVRGVDKSGKVKVEAPRSDQAKLATEAKQNQEFNRDDIDEFKVKEYLGEAKDGHLVILPKEIGAVKSMQDNERKFMELLCTEENRDRGIVVARLINTNENLSKKDLDGVRKVYRDSLIEKSPVGSWIESLDGQWQKKKESPNSNKAVTQQ
jgi:uncharacterized protein YdbL (DUF1318 family)